MRQFAMIYIKRHAAVTGEKLPAIAATTRHF